MDDLISRQAAIDAIMGQPPEPHYPSWYAAQIEKLPAVQPATNCSEIPNGSDDTISRQAAIDALGEKPLAWTEGEYELGLQNQWQSDVDALKALPAVQPLVIHCTDCEDWLERQSILGVTITELPSAQPKPKTGHWIYDGDQIICNRCFKAFGFISLKLTSNYCPNCGAKMIEPQESEDKE